MCYILAMWFFRFHTADHLGNVISYTTRIGIQQTIGIIILAA